MQRKFNVLPATIAPMGALESAFDAPTETMVTITPLLYQSGYVTNYESHYQQMLFIIFSLLTNFLVDVEVHTPKGRADIVLLTQTDLYIIELKLNQSAQAAMQQINLKNYRKGSPSVASPSPRWASTSTPHRAILRIG